MVSTKILKRKRPSIFTTERHYGEDFFFLEFVPSICSRSAPPDIDSQNKKGVGKI